MTLDPRTPVVVGVGQVVQRCAPAEAVETVALMTQAVEAAVDDSGASALAAGATAVRVVNGAWRYPDPARIVAERIGATGATTGLSTDGGNTPQYLVNLTCGDLLAGRHETVVLVGCETIYTRRRARAAGVKIPTTIQEGVEPDEVLGADVTMSNEHERSRGLEMPINFYPLFESAIRASRGESVDDHRDRISRLWEGFNRVAVENPFAWRREPLTWEQIREPDDDNRMVGFPYTKAMNSNWDLDQAAAVILTTVEAAERLGVPRDRWVFPLVGTDGMDTANVTNRGDLHSSPAIRHAGARAFELAGVGPDDLAHVDLYSCFPSAVQIGATELGLGQDRQLTVTGGLTFAGGPLNNYVMHSIATMVGVLREDAGSIGMCTANGGYVTKHAIGLYSTEPPAAGFRHDDVQAKVDAEPTTGAADDHVGPGTIEAYTVMHGRDGAEVGLVAIATPDRRRAWGSTRDAELLVDMCRTEHIGRAVELDPDGVVHPE
ncbi:MAG: acetyl-CoA acetyltransferase [Actinomycetota bacterium]